MTWNDMAQNKVVDREHRLTRASISIPTDPSFTLDLLQSLVDLPFFLLGLWLRKFVS